MTEIFVSYARATVQQAEAMAALLRRLGHGVWRDDDLPPHRPFVDVIEERLRSARAVLVLWSDDAARSHWVRAEAELGRQLGSLVPATLDGSPLPLPFSQIRCADLTGWDGDSTAPGLRKLLDSIAELTGRKVPSARLHAGRDNRRAHQAPMANVALRRYDSRPSVAVLEAGPATDLGAALVADIRSTLGRQADIRLCEDGAAASYRVEILPRLAGTRARVTGRLIVTADGSQLWCDRFDGDASDPSGLVDEIGEAVCANVEAVLRRARIAAAVAAPDGAGGAVPAAMAAVNRMQADGYRDVLAILAPELAPDAGNADALALAALAHACFWTNGFPDVDVGAVDAGLTLARRAIRRTDSAPFVTGLSAVAMAMLGAPVEVSLALSERVQAMNPGFAPAHLWAGQVRLLAGDADGAIARLQAAQRLDPRMTVRPLLLGWLGAARMLAGQHKAAAATLLEAVELTSGIPMNPLFLAATLGFLGRPAEGRQMLAQAAALAPPHDFRLALPPPMLARLREGLATLD